MSGYQIVNGCQTCHEIYNNRDRLGKDVSVAVKLVVTTDSEITSQIIKATNRQTEVKMEAFESLSPFHRNLEEFYNSFGKDDSKRVYYERRSKQYANSQIKSWMILSLAAQAQAFLGMYLNEPHSTHRYYGEILRNYPDKIFSEKHTFWVYYTAGLALSRLELLIRRGLVPAEIRRFKHHIICLVRAKLAPGDYPAMMGKTAEENAKKICGILWNEVSALELFREAAAEVLGSLNEFTGDKALANRLKAFTVHLLAKYADSATKGNVQSVPPVKVPSAKKRFSGTVAFWDVDKGFGFIKVSDQGYKEDIFLHYSAVHNFSDYRFLREGESLEFEIVKTDRGLQARSADLKA